MNKKNMVLMSVLLLLVFVFGLVVGLNAPNKEGKTHEDYLTEKVTLDELEGITGYDSDIVSMSLVRANQMNRNTVTIWDPKNDTIYVNMTLTDFGDVGISHNTKLILTKNGIIHEPVNFVEFVKTGYICRKTDKYKISDIEN